MLLVSGGASVGEKDFTRALLEWLRFEIVFSQVNVRPGRPLIFGVSGGAPVLRSSTATEGGSAPASLLGGSLAPPNKIRFAFGLPGNPLSHFVCFHLFVAAALANLVGEEPRGFRRGTLAAKLEDVPCPRETLWPAKWHGCPAREFQAREAGSGNWKLAGETPAPLLIPLKWSSSGDVTCLAETDALIRVPANRGLIESGAEVDFLPINC